MSRSPSLDECSRRRRNAQAWPCLGVLALFTALISRAAHPQSLEERLDSRQFLEGLVELQLPEVLDQYMRTHPAVDEAMKAEYQIAVERLAESSPPVSEAGRLAVVERILEIRSKLIAEHPTDPRRALWMADQATELFFDLLPIDAAGLTSLFGVPSPVQHQRAKFVGAQVHQLAEQAEPAVEQLVSDLETSPDFGRNTVLQERRQDLVEREGRRRIPFLRGVGGFLQAELNLDDEAEKIRLYALAAEVLTPLGDVLDGAAATQARQYAGLAHARLGEFDQAELFFEQVARDGDSTPADVFAARMGGVLNRTMRGGPEAGLEALNSIESRYAGGEGLFFRVLIADQRFKLRKELAGQAAPAQRDQLMAEAFAAYTALLEADDLESVERETIRSIILARLAIAADADTPLDQLPPIVALARADQLSRDAQTREQAIIMLESAVNSGLLDDAEQASARFILARALYDHGHFLFAARRFIELAGNHPSDHQAERAIELGVALAGDLHQHDPSDAEARTTLRDGLTVLLERYPNLRTIDQWRYVAGRLALEEKRFDEAGEFFSQIQRDAHEWPDAHFMKILIARAKAGAGPDDQRQKFNEQALATIQDVRPVIEAAFTSAADPKRAAALRYYLAMLHIFRAQALLDLNRPQQAIDALAGIEKDSGLSGHVLGEALKARIDAARSLGRLDEVMGEIQEFVQASPADAGTVLAPALAALERDVLELLETSRDEQAAELAQRTLLPTARLLEEWLKSSRASQADHDALGFHIADAYRLSGRYSESLAWYDRLLPANPDAMELLVGRAECLYHLGGEQRWADAMLHYKRIAAAGPDAGKDQYWLAQLRMLQIIDRVNRNTQQIVPRIERLRQHDGELGGERYRRGFDALRSKYAH